MQATGENSCRIEKWRAAPSRKIGPTSKRTVAANNMKSGVKTGKMVTLNERNLLKKEKQLGCLIVVLFRVDCL